MCHSCLAVLRAVSGVRPSPLRRYQHAVGLHVCMHVEDVCIHDLRYGTRGSSLKQVISLDAGRPMEICTALCFELSTRERCSYGGIW